MVAFLLVLLILIVLGSNEAVGYYFSHCDGEDTLDCFLGRIEDEPPAEGSVVATGVYEYKGYAVTVTANIPLEGGKVTGSMDGTCEGQLKGTYDGQPNGGISGTISGVCSPFFINIPASADYSGIVNKTSKTVPLSFTGRGGGITHKGSMSLSYP